MSKTITLNLRDYEAAIIYLALGDVIEDDVKLLQELQCDEDEKGELLEHLSICEELRSILSDNLTKLCYLKKS